MKIRPRSLGTTKKMEWGIPKIGNTILLAAFILVCFCGAAVAGGPFGPPQTVSKDAGGLNTAIGYWWHEDTLENSRDHKIRQNQIYSQLAYGALNWEAYGRLGLADLKISDVFHPTQSTTVTSKGDFQDNWNFFGTMGAKGFYPFNRTFGVGAFVPGSYTFGDYNERLSGTQGGAPFAIDVKAKNFWDVNLGIAFQATLPREIKLYLGPYLYYAEATISPSARIPGLEFSGGDTYLKNKTPVGGFAGFDLPLFRGFHLNVEGQYSEKFSVGAALLFSY